MSSLREDLKPRPCRIDRAIARLIRQGRGLRFSRKDRTFEVNKGLLYGFLLWFCRPEIGPWALRENNALELANQSTRYIDYKH